MRGRKLVLGTGLLQWQYSTSQSTADDHIDDVSCRGSEAKLTDCSHRLSTLDSYDYIYMQCQRGKSLLSHSMVVLCI